MNTAQMAMLGVAFLAVTLVSYAILRIVSARHQSRRIALASTQEVPSARSQATARPGAAVTRMFLRLGSMFSAGTLGDAPPLRLRFLQAGLGGADAPAIYHGVKTMLTLALPIVGAGALMWLDTRPAWGAIAGLLILLAATGFYLPNVWLGRAIERRQHELREHFPDAIDLMRLCVEAGLGLDAAFARVEKEIRFSSEAMYDELHLVSLELRAGASRERVLKNLAMRIGLSDVDSLVAMLIQVERFGTSVADSLRIHSELLRTKRRQRVQEQAAKIPVKLLFPMIFFIFPSLMVVLLGPALISVLRTLKSGLPGS